MATMFGYALNTTLGIEVISEALAHCGMPPNLDDVPIGIEICLDSDPAKRVRLAGPDRSGRKRRYP
jgi:hypothetical protein